jgi:hypothetical protein
MNLLLVITLLYLLIADSKPLEFFELTKLVKKNGEVVVYFKTISLIQSEDYLISEPNRSATNGPAHCPRSSPTPKAKKILPSFKIAVSALNNSFSISLL